MKYGWLRKGIVLALASFIVAEGAAGGAIPALANNYKDTTFSFSYYGDGTDAAISARKKQDNTACYMKNNASSPSLQVGVAGTNSASKIDAINPNRCSKVYTISSGNYKYISNTVYNNYTYAYLVMGCDDKKSHTISGKWSPDNISNRY